MMPAYRLRAARPEDLAEILPRTAALNAHEGIAIGNEALEVALRRLLGDRTLGGVWLVCETERIIGYAIVTYGYDLEFAGRDAWLTELWIDASARGQGAARAALDQLPAVLRGAGVAAVHLQVREENPAMRLYARAGFATSPRRIMTRKL